MKWTPERKQQAIDDIINHISSGKSLRSLIDNSDRDIIPSFPTFYEWMKDDEELAKQYARATSIRADILFEEILEIADDGKNDTYTKDGVELVNHDVIARSRLRVDSRKWAASKMNPKKYGDKTDITSGGQPIKTPGAITVQIVKADDDS